MTDIEGSTRLWEQEPQAMSEALARHESILVQTAPRFGGRVIKSKGEGDAAFLVFPTALGAVQCAAELQRLFEVEKWPGTPILVRMACHVGLAEMRDEDYFGTTINKCARLRAIAYGGQVLLSNDAKEQLPAEHPLLDLGIHRLRDLQRPERVFQLLTDGLRSSFPALRSLEAFPNNLPSQRNAFVAREKELRKAAELLESCRLLTLTGIGGGGKTRLALQAGAELLPQFPDGVWFIDLAPLHDGRLVPQVTAEALSIREAPGKSVSEALLNYLSDRKLLLILDNCEHVVEAAAELADLFLARCPNVRLVATSREPLNIAGESVLRVPPLSIPDSSEDLEAIKRSESVQLFTEKARESNHAFELTSENSEAVAEICRRLDGIPLALELAAARLRSASPQQISSRLTERFRLLTGGSRVALPRQQTLQALIDWSHDLLSPAEKQMLSRVSVFAGGWTIAAAEAVCAGGEIDELDVFDLLTSLVDRSLVVPSELGGEMVRYTLLETVREYAAGKLSQSGEGETLRRRHHEYFTAFAAAAEGKLFGPEGQTLQKQLQQEHDNFREAMRLALPDEAIRLAGSLWRLWYAAGYLAEGRRMLTRALESYVGPVTESLAKCQTGYGAMSWRSLDLQEAEDTTLKALASWGELEDEAGMASALSTLGLIIMERAEYDKASAYYAESLKLRERIGDRFGLANTYNNMGILCWHMQDLGGSLDNYAKALVLRKQLGDEMGAADTLQNMGLIGIERGSLEEAEVHFRSALEIYQRRGARANLATTLENLGVVAMHRGDTRQARELLNKTRRISAEMSMEAAVVGTEFHIACCDLLEERYSEAAQSLVHIYEFGATMGNLRLEVDALLGLGTLASRLARQDFARVLFSSAQKRQEQSGLRGPKPHPFIDASRTEALGSEEHSGPTLEEVIRAICEISA